MQAIGILGGTFDPVHIGHLRLALEMRDRLDLCRVHLVPAREPPHRAAPRADPETRLRMLRAAVFDTPGLVADDRELRRSGPSYTADTLDAVRREFPEYALCLIVGMDAFARLNTWYRWPDIAELAHLGVAGRSGTSPPRRGPIGRLIDERRSDDPREMCVARGGRIFIADVPHLDISATRIRDLVARRQSPRYLVPESVMQIISTLGIYQNGE